MKVITWLTGFVIAVAAVAALLAWSGAYNVAADEPHWPLIERLMETVRDRSAAVRASGTVVPDLDDESLIRTGAGNYEAMCADCHLQPGVAKTELSFGLYPAPPQFAKERPDDPAAAFWVIKHGLKMSGMPAWGKSMNDESIWGMVAFLRKLPDLSPTRYRELVATSSGHSHGTAPEEPHDHDDETEHMHGEETKIHVHADGSQHEHRN
jgi:mono/diheme cytochrome c family protein